MAIIAIKNGRRVEIDGPVSGEQLANIATNGRPGRRAVMSDTKEVSNRTIDRRKTYNLNELTRSDGKPIRLTDIPERVKGAGFESAGTYLSPRSDLSKSLIYDQIYAVSEHLFKGQKIEFDDGAHSVVIPKFVLPEGWSPRTTPLMIVFPVEYPDLPPNGFYIAINTVPPPDKGGHIFSRHVHGGFGSTPEQEKWLRDNNWVWYCAYVQAGAWSPAKIRELSDWRYGDNLFTFFTLINEVLNERE